MNRFIRADSQKCIGCRACEVACVMSHNDEQHVLDVAQFIPRITVVKNERQRGAATCHHCEDAPCARSCPNGAIRQVDDAIQIDQAKCIGCKSCAVACPFGTMQIVLAPTQNGGVKATAHKCDLCHQRPSGPACVENCPADALQMITSQQLADIARTRRLQTACREAQPWHADARAPAPATSLSKVQQMAQTPPRGEADKLNLAARKTGFAEIYLPLSAEQAQQATSRCLSCGEHSVCEWTCPLHNHIPQWIDRVKAGDIDAAVALSHQTNPLPEITGRVCPQDRLCEGACTLRDEHGAVIRHEINTGLSAR